MGRRGSLYSLLLNGFWVRKYPHCLLNAGSSNRIIASCKLLELVNGRDVMLVAYYYWKQCILAMCAKCNEIQEINPGRGRANSAHQMIHDSNTLNTIKRLAWVTDIHLDYLEPEQIRTFCRELVEHGPDALLIGGDIGTATSISSYLLTLANELSCAVYFVLGNHDYYYGSIKVVRQEVAEICKQSDQLNWLPSSGVVGLTDQTCLIGHDGWGDGRLGDYPNSTVMLNDYLLIKELAGLDPNERLTVLKKLGDEAAAYLRNQLQSALDHYQNVIVLTHVPPFKQRFFAANLFDYRLNQTSSQI